VVALGAGVGVGVGFSVGRAMSEVGAGVAVRAGVGCAVGWAVGWAVGCTVGWAVGWTVGAAVVDGDGDGARLAMATTGPWVATGSAGDGDGAVVDGSLGEVEACGEPLGATDGSIDGSIDGEGEAESAGRSDGDGWSDAAGPDVDPTPWLELESGFVRDVGLGVAAPTPLAAGVAVTRSAVVVSAGRVPGTYPLPPKAPIATPVRTSARFRRPRAATSRAR
jgi:hypothetical protein